MRVPEAACISEPEYSCIVCANYQYSGLSIWVGMGARSGERSRAKELG